MSYATSSVQIWSFQFDIDGFFYVSCKPPVFFGQDVYNCSTTVFCCFHLALATYVKAGWVNTTQLKLSSHLTKKPLGWEVKHLQETETRTVSYDIALGIILFWHSIKNVRNYNFMWADDGSGHQLAIILFTFSTCAFITSTEPHELSSSPLWMVEFHTWCLCNGKFSVNCST